MHFGSDFFALDYYGSDHFDVSASGAASGATVVVTAVLITGTASGSLDETLVVGSFKQQVIRINAKAPGDILVCVSSLISGKSHGQKVRLLPGTVTADANVKGKILVMQLRPPANKSGHMSDEENIILMAAA